VYLHARLVLCGGSIWGCVFNISKMNEKQYCIEINKTIFVFDKNMFYFYPLPFFDAARGLLLVEI
jgi:hypothetical protein